MDITGARWGLEGAEAVLKIRALIATGDSEDYWRFHPAGSTNASTMRNTARPTSSQRNQLASKEPHPKQIAQLRSLIIGRDPRQLQFEFALWTRQVVGELIRRKFGVEYTPQGIGKLLRDIGLSPQRPLVRANEQNPERVRIWKEEEYPAIQAAAKAAGASIFFATRRGYGLIIILALPGHRSGKRRSCANREQKVAQHDIGGFSARRASLRKLMSDIPGPIFLIADGHSVRAALSLPWEPRERCG
jgi:transposase